MTLRSIPSSGGESGRPHDRDRVQQPLVGGQVDVIAHRRGADRRGRGGPFTGLAQPADGQGQGVPEPVRPGPADQLARDQPRDQRPPDRPAPPTSLSRPPPPPPPPPRPPPLAPATPAH